MLILFLWTLHMHMQSLLKNTILWKTRSDRCDKTCESSSSKADLRSFHCQFPSSAVTQKRLLREEEMNANSRCRWRRCLRHIISGSCRQKNSNIRLQVIDIILGMAWKTDYFIGSEQGFSPGIIRST